MRTVRRLVALLGLLAVCLASVGADLRAAQPIDLFADAPKLADGFVRIGAWNLRHLNVEGGADEVLPGATRDEDFRQLIATFAKAIDDLGLDLVAVVEHQPHPGEPNRLAQLRDALNGAAAGPWKMDETNIEYDEPYNAEVNPFGGLQFGMLWNTARGVEIDGASDRLLDELRQPRDAAGQLTQKRTRVPWLAPVKLKSPTGKGGLEFDLITLHLKSGGSSPQAEEVDALTKFMRAHQEASPRRHLVVCGDWNIRPDQAIGDQGRPRLKKMMLPTETGSLMRLLTVGDLRPSLAGWERIDDLVGNLGNYEPLETVLPYTHLPDGDTDPYTLLDHFAISRTLESVFDHPLEVTRADGRKDLQPGIQIVRPLLHEEKYRKLTDHLPVIMTLRVPGEPTITPNIGRMRIMAAEPNPVGDERAAETVHLKNVSDQPIDLAGWQIRDSAGVPWRLNAGDFAALADGKLPAGQTLIVRRNNREMSLTNTGDSIILVDPAGKTIDSKTYGEAPAGQLLRFE